MSKSQDRPKRQKKRSVRDFKELAEHVEKPAPEMPPVEPWDKHLYRSIYGEWPKQDE